MAARRVEPLVNDEIAGSETAATMAITAMTATISNKVKARVDDETLRHCAAVDNPSHPMKAGMLFMSLDRLASRGEAGKTYFVTIR